MDMFIDFDNIDIIGPETGPIIKEKKYDVQYNELTNEFYKNMREKKYNVFTHERIEYDEQTLFKFKYMWDPYTGCRKQEDPFGPLYFHPDDLINYFYKKRLNLLWNEPKDEFGGYYQGYYGDGVGSGKDINISGRGIYPELYLFRLPIDDCYLPQDSDLSLISMGPILTDEEIKEIYNLAETYHKDNYVKFYYKKRPNLIEMKRLYELALNNAIPNFEKENRLAVNELRIM